MLPVAIGRRSVDIYMHPIPYPEDTGSLPPLQNTCNVSFDRNLPLYTRSNRILSYKYLWMRTVWRSLPCSFPEMIRCVATSFRVLCAVVLVLSHDIKHALKLSTKFNNTKNDELKEEKNTLFVKSLTVNNLHDSVRIGSPFPVEF